VSARAQSAFHISFHRNKDAISWDTASKGFKNDESDHNFRPVGHQNAFQGIHPQAIEQNGYNTHRTLPIFVATIDGDHQFDPGIFHCLYSHELESWGAAPAKQHGRNLYGD
jgi:hypothetical protein